MKWIIWSGFPLTTCNIHYFTFGMTIPTTNCKRLSKIRSQMINIIVYQSSWLWNRNCLPVKSEFYFSKFKKLLNDSRVTCFTRIRSKTEKYFFDFKLKCFTSTIRIIKIQWTNSFHVTTIYLTYLNYFNKLEILQIYFISNLSFFIVSTYNNKLSI